MRKTKRARANLIRRTPETLRAIEKGMIWTHKENANYKALILPNEVSTIEDIRKKLIDALPVNHPDRKRMEQNGSSKSYIREHINTVFCLPNTPSLARPRSSAYGFIVRYRCALS